MKHLNYLKYFYHHNKFLKSEYKLEFQLVKIKNNYQYFLFIRRIYIDMRNIKKILKR